MACLGCDHTMQRVVPDVFWCPRCGTLKHGQGFDKPRLIERTVQLLNELDEISVQRAFVLGVTESCTIREKNED